MTDSVEMLLERVRSFSPGDVLEAAEILETLEKTILLEETDFDDAALLSRVLEEFSSWIKAGSPAKTDNLLSWLPKPAPAPAPAPNAGIGVRKSGAEKLDVDVEVLFSFLTEAREHLESIEARILSLESDPDPKIVNEIFRSVHTIKGVSGFLNLHQIKKLSHELESLLDELRTRSRLVDRSLVDLLLLGCDTLSQLVDRVAQAAGAVKTEKGTVILSLNDLPIDDVLSAIGQLRGGKAVPVPAELQSPKEADLTQNADLIEKFAQESMETLELVERCLLTMEKTRATGDDLNQAFRSIHTLKGNAGFFGLGALESLCMEMESFLEPLRKGEKSVDSETIETSLSFLDRLKSLVQHKPGLPSAPEPAVLTASAAEVPKTDSDGLGKYSVKKKDIRVDTDKLDSMFDLIGELITAEAMVIDNPEVHHLEHGSFSRAATYLSKITREIQSVMMSIRMIPLEGLFGKMNRLVRDLGRKVGKEIQLEISGAETEMDRSIIEEISDPLVHIIRNALDHGIEDDATRKAKGKPTGGRIRLNARYEGNEIWITVADDGAGLDRDRILEVAKAKGLVSGTPLSDQEVWRLIFEPGFSTAKVVSEISGRGVGMDVVKKNLEKLRGQIDIRTAPGKGTDFILKIPLTLAIIDGVTLRSGKTLYSIPIADVVEFQNYQPERETKTDPEHSVLRLRDEILPVLPLSEIFVASATGEDSAGAKKVSIIVKSQNRKMALVVDEIVGYKQIVLKALPESMTALEGISGCTILGNGEVSLIIDVDALFARYLG